MFFDEEYGTRTQLRDYFITQAGGSKYGEDEWYDYHSKEWDCSVEQLKKFMEDPDNADEELVEHIRFYLKQDYEENC